MSSSKSFSSVSDSGSGSSSSGSVSASSVSYSSVSTSVSSTSESFSSTSDSVPPSSGSSTSTSGSNSLSSGSTSTSESTVSMSSHDPPSISVSLSGSPPSTSDTSDHSASGSVSISYGSTESHSVDVSVGSGSDDGSYSFGSGSLSSGSSLGSDSFSSSTEECGHCGWILGVTQLTGFKGVFSRDGEVVHTFNQSGPSTMTSCTSWTFPATQDTTGNTIQIQATFDPSSQRWTLGSGGANAMFTGGGIGSGCAGPNDTTVSGNRSWEISSTIVTPLLSPLRNSGAGLRIRPSS